MDGTGGYTPSISSATRLATDIAATRLGWVHATNFPFVCGRSENATNCGILLDRQNNLMLISQL